MWFLKRSLVLLIAIFAFPIATPVLAADQPADAGKDGDHVKQVEAKFVCMINKKHFASPQTAVSVGTKTYYGCCDMCKDKLTSDPSSRVEVDPVSGKTVDKASAVIGVDKAGNAYFFENVDNLKKFRAPKTVKKTASAVEHPRLPSFTRIG